MPFQRSLMFGGKAKACPCEKLLLGKLLLDYSGKACRGQTPYLIGKIHKLQLENVL
jgi:hypothetical protein